MQKRRLGNSSLEVYPLAFGGNVLGWTLDEKSSFEVLDSFVYAGFNFIDTADIYSRWKKENVGGESETILGNWMKKRNIRNNLIIATKVGGDMGLGKVCLSKKYILEEVDRSLARLQTDYIDLYQAHFDDTSTRVGETLEAFDTLIKIGKVRTIGASNFSPSRLEESLIYSKENGLSRYESFQPEYNLYTREKFEKEFEIFCTKEKLGVITYFSLASGFLTGKYKNDKDTAKSIRGGGMVKYLTPRGAMIIEELEKEAIKYQVTPAAISLAWLMSRPSVTAPIASATSINQVEQLARAALINLNEEDIHHLNMVSNY